MRGHRWPEHPESGGHQRVHQVQLPEAHFARKGQHGNDEDDQSARAIEKHYEMATIFAVDDDTGEWQHQQRRDRLQDDYCPQRHLRMRDLKDVPDNGGSVHAAPQHGDQIGDKDES